MKIVHIISTYPPVGGGTELACQALARRQARAGMRVWVVTRAIGGGGVPRHERNGGVEVHRVGVPPGRTLGGLWFTMRAGWLASGLAPDVIHCHQALSPGLAGVLASAIGGGPRVVLKLACTGPYGERAQMEGPLRPVRSRMLARADRVVVLSEEGRQEALDLGIDPRRIQKIPNGVDTERLAPPDPARRDQLRQSLGLDGPTFIWTGRLTVQKVPDLALEEFAVALGVTGALNVRPGSPWASRRPALLIVGEGRDRPRLEEKARRLGLGIRVRFLGWRTDVADLLCAADAFVTTSRSEGMSNALLEAMATGLVALAADIPANREVVTDGHDGWLYGPDLGARMARLMEEGPGGGAFPTAMGQRARETVLARFALADVARRYEGLYERLLAQ